MPDQNTESFGTEAYRLPTGESLVSATSSPPALAQPSETGVKASVSNRDLPLESSEPEETTSLEGELGSLRRRLNEQERMLRGIQSRYDRETARLRQQLNEQRRQATEDIASPMQSAGAAASQIAAFGRVRAQEDKMEESREQANPLPAAPAQLVGNQAAQRYIRDICAAADVDPNDARLNLSTPSTFRASLNQIKADRTKNTERRTQSTEPRKENAEGKPKERRSARLDLDVLGGGGGGAIHDLPDDLDELWKLAKKETPSLRERA